MTDMTQDEQSPRTKELLFYFIEKKKEEKKSDEK